MTTLRPLQESAIDGLRKLVADGASRVLLVAPTGFGKTVVIAAIARGHLSCVGAARVLVVVHRRELATQTVRKLADAGIHDVGVIQAESDADESARVVVASIQTLMSRGARPRATMVIWDEAHHCPAASFREVYQAYPDALHLGATATPQRSDGKPLGDMFEAMHVGASVRELTKLGLLAPCDVLAPGGLREGLVIEPVEAYRKYTPGRPAVVFAASVAHARQLAEQFNEAGIAAACVDGETDTDDRDDILARFASGTLDVVTNCFVLTEGWDAPRAEVCVLARAPDHVGTLLQMVGRVLRPAPWKSHATVLDLQGSVIMHGLPDEDRRWSLTGTACVRTEKVTSLQRCAECLAVFRPAKRCPRCGAEKEVIERIPRVLRRAEKLERISHLSQEERDRRTFWQLVGVAKRRMGMDDGRAHGWAVRKFMERFGRRPGGVAA